MKKKDYQKPTMQIVCMREISLLLVASEGIDSTRLDYEEGGIEEWL